MKTLLAAALVAVTVGAFAQPGDWRHRDNPYWQQERAEREWRAREWQRQPEVPDQVISRRIERYGNRRVIVTTTRHCTDARWDRQHRAVCLNWTTVVTREPVRRRPGSRNLDLNGDGRTDGWERLLFQSFRRALD